REQFVVEGCYLLRDRFLAEEVWEVLGLPVEACKRYVDGSDLMRMYRTSLFTRIVPTIKDIGLWGPRVRKAYADMDILGFAGADLDALAVRDEEIAQGFGRRRQEIERVAALGAGASAGGSAPRSSASAGRCSSARRTSTTSPGRSQPAATGASPPTANFR